MYGMSEADQSTAVFWRYIQQSIQIHTYVPHVGANAMETKINTGGCRRDLDTVYLGGIYSARVGRLGSWWWRSRAAEGVLSAFFKKKAKPDLVRKYIFVDNL